VAQFLVLIFKGATYCDDRVDLCVPFADVEDPANPGTRVFDPVNPDYARLDAQLRLLPPMVDLESLTRVEIEALLDAISVLLFPLLSWMIESFPVEVRRLTGSECLSFINTGHQFSVNGDLPANSVDFQTDKERFGSLFAFHATTFKSLFRILHEGFQIPPHRVGTAYGSVYGPGFYSAPQSSEVAFYGHLEHYPGPMEKKPAHQTTLLRSTNVKNLKCLILTEVVVGPDFNIHENERGNMHYRCTNMSHVRPLFVFVYDWEKGANDVNLRGTTVRQEIERALAQR